MSNSTPSRGDRGGSRGRGAGRGRGRGGASTNFKAVAMDYDALPAKHVTTPSATPRPFVPYAPSPAQDSPSTSGYNTPKRGLAFSAQNGNNTPSYSRGGSTTRGNDRGSGRGGRGRGRGSGGLGFSAERILGVAGAERPFLIPVAFVAASQLPLGLGGDDEEEKAAVVFGELEDQVMNGGLIEIVKEYDSEDSSDELPQQDDDPEDSMVDQVEDLCIAQEEEVSISNDPALDMNRLYVSDITPSLPHDDSASNPLRFDSTFVLGLTPTQDATASDSDSDSEEIVFVPSALAATAYDPVEPTSSFTADESFTATTDFLIPPPADSPPASPKADPTPKAKPLTKNQKRELKKAGKKARKAGKAHARSGNQHLFADAPPDSDDEEGHDGVGDGIEESKPREGDSDLDWGSNGPGEEESRYRPKPRSGARKERRRLEREEAKDEQRIERLSIGAREQVAFSLQQQLDDDELAATSSTTFLVNSQANIVPLSTKRAKGGHRNRRDEELDEAARDYAENVFGLKPSGGSSGSEMGETSLVEDMSFLLRMDGSKTINDLADDAAAAAEEEEGGAGWRTTDGEDDSESEDEIDSDDELEMDIALGEADAQVDIALALVEDAEIELTGSELSSSDDEESSRQIEAALLSGNTVRFSSMGQSGPGGRRDKKEKKRMKKGKGKWESGSSDDEMFDGNGTWADDGDDYVRGVQNILNENSHLLDSGNRKARNKMFKAIEDGDFRGVDFDDDMSFAPSGSGRKPRHKQPSTSGVFADSLQEQWANDRSKKGEYKEARALARAKAQDARPYFMKKGAKPPPARHGTNSSDVASINLEIREFLLALSKTSLALPPMSKKSRVAVHLLAEVYGLQSKSLGKGSSRFPVLERGPNSKVFGVDERRIKAIIATAAGESSSSYGRGASAGSAKAKGKMGGLWAALAGDLPRKSGGGGGGGAGRGGGNDQNKNREGAVVGQGADRLGEGNVGYELLKRMGWTAGTLMGSSGGIEEPIVARLKMGKSGLGSGFGATRAEAQKLGRSGY